MAIDRISDAPDETFDDLCARVIACMNRYEKRFGFEQYEGFTVLEDHWGSSQVLVTVGDLRVLTPEIVKRLRRIVSKFPRWEIVVTIAVDGHLYDWPNMGLYIRGHEIIDGLQRDYFPSEFQNLAFEGAIPGGEND